MSNDPTLSPTSTLLVLASGPPCQIISTYKGPTRLRNSGRIRLVIKWMPLMTLSWRALCACSKICSDHKSFPHQYNMSSEVVYPLHH